MDIVTFRYRFPALVSTIVGELGLDALTQGASADEIYFRLWHNGADPCRLLLAALTSGDFATLPKIQVRAVRPRYRERYIGNTVVRDVEGTLLFTEAGVADGDRVLMFLQETALDTRSALRHVLLAENKSPARPPSMPSRRSARISHSAASTGIGR